MGIIGMMEMMSHQTTMEVLAEEMALAHLEEVVMVGVDNFLIVEVVLIHTEAVVMILMVTEEGGETLIQEDIKGMPLWIGQKRIYMTK